MGVELRGRTPLRRRGCTGGECWTRHRRIRAGRCEGPGQRLGKGRPCVGGEDAGHSGGKKGDVTGSIQGTSRRILVVKQRLLVLRPKLALRKRQLPSLLPRTP